MTPVETEERRAAEVEHLSVAERVALGKAARASTPRSNHAEFEPASNRPDPITLLERQAESRVPELVPIRYGRMGVSPFTFYRGAALLQAADLAHTPSSGLQVQLCGDAHLSNFGVFASPERRLVFDINDFDETLPGPWEWDVKRLAASLSVAGRENGYPEARTQDDRARRRRRLPRDAARACRQDQPRRLVLAPGRRGPDGHDAPAGAEGDAQAHREGARQGQDQGQHAGLQEAHAGGGR